MSATAQLKTLFHIAVAPIRGETHAERLESFYGPQADYYDRFRARLLHGRDELFAALPTPKGGVWVDLGAGTGENAERLGPRLQWLSQVHLVDLTPSLLAEARRRIVRHGWDHVQAVRADARTFSLPAGSVDLITCSYSLTMMPDWFAVLDNARQMLKPGGRLGVVDFFTARKHPESGLAKHNWATRTFWPAWFAADNVFLNPDHAPYLRSLFETVRFEQLWGKAPFLPGLRVPYYLFIGTKP